MKKLFTVSLTILMSVFALGCDDDGTGVDRTTLDDLAGTFSATRFEFTNNANRSQSRELISEGGRFSLQIDREGRFFETFRSPDGTTEVRQGRVEVRGSNLAFIDDGATEPRLFAFRRSGNNLTLRRDNDRFDFNNDGVLDAATFETELRRDG